MDSPYRYQRKWSYSSRLEIRSICTSMSYLWYISIRFRRSNGSSKPRMWSCIRTHRCEWCRWSSMGEWSGSQWKYCWSSDTPVVWIRSIRNEYSTSREYPCRLPNTGCRSRRSILFDRSYREWMRYSLAYGKRSFTGRKILENIWSYCYLSHIYKTMSSDGRSGWIMKASYRRALMTSTCEGHDKKW